MLIDYHTHSPLCKHATGRLENYIQQAFTMGLDEIGCSDHVPMPNDFDIVHRMSLEEYHAEYSPSVNELRGKYEGKIKVRKGIEADYFSGTENWVREFIKANDFDYVIGSVHYLGEIGVDEPIFVHRYDPSKIDQIFEQYFDAVRMSAESRLFDIIGHCDLPKKFGHRPSKDLRERIRAMLEAIKKNDLCIEINTSGLRKPVKEIYPGEEILTIARELNIPLTIGSDAHSPEDVGRDFVLATELVERFGNGHIAIFENRVRKEIAISKY